MILKDGAPRGNLIPLVPSLLRKNRELSPQGRMPLYRRRWEGLGVGRAGVACVAAREMNLQGKQRRQLGVDEGLLVLEQVKVKAGKGHQSKKNANSVEAEIALSFVVARELQRWRARFC